MALRIPHSQPQALFRSVNLQHPLALKVELNTGTIRVKSQATQTHFENALSLDLFRSSYVHFELKEFLPIFRFTNLLASKFIACYLIIRILEMIRLLEKKLSEISAPKVSLVPY